MTDELLQKVVSEISGKEREIVNEFCKAFIAQKCLEGFDPRYLFDNFVLNVQHDFHKDMCSKYWFTPRTK